MSNTPKSPYAAQPAHAFWRSAMVERHPVTQTQLHQPKFPLTPSTRLMTAGSCFAQHLHRTLSKRGWSVIAKEDADDHMPPAIADRYAYGQYSARYGNIYTARQWVELIQEALNDAPAAPLIWERDGRYVDALRPAVEPHGLASKAEVAQARAAHIKAVRAALHEADCIIFTLGLTEAWVDRATGRTLPTAPGTLAGNMADTPADFINFGYDDILKDLQTARSLLREINSSIRFLLTVSPVPLTATATAAHVVQASTTSKAILRTVSDALQRQFEDVDYFPSFEIITTSVLGGPFFDANLRSPTKHGVQQVMQVFTQSYTGETSQPALPEPQQNARTHTGPDSWDAACEDMLLDAFAK